jgi:aryl-alcohol dehydrogenase-like predicted oxidoreductase
MRLSKLCLGTAQLGMDYGINNPEGKPSFEQARDIVRAALESGVNAFDTAPEYGDSEIILGKCLSGSEKKKIVFISKFPPADWSKSVAEIKAGVEKEVKKSLNNLGVKQIPIYLFHRFEDIEKEDKLTLKELLRMKKQGLIGKLGVSIYTPEEAERALSIEGIEVIQAPFNLIDKRLLENGLLKRAKQKGILFLARSVFLQGLFFRKEIPEQISGFKPYQGKIMRLCKEKGMSAEELALRYSLSIKEIDSVLVGVEKTEQLVRNIEIWKKGKLSDALIKKVNSWGSAPEKAINPRLWGLNK